MMLPPEKSKTCWSTKPKNWSWKSIMTERLYDKYSKLKYGRRPTFGFGVKLGGIKHGLGRSGITWFVLHQWQKTELTNPLFLSVDTA